MSGIC